MSTQYDKIAHEYKDALQSIRTRQILDHTLQRHIGGVAGMSVLDLACGSGDFTRNYKRKGAARVVGVDISQEMLKLARQDEAREPLGIEYICCDVAELGKVGDFDLVAASYLLNYARTEAQLRRMCQVVHDNLKPGRRFVTLNHNVKMSQEEYDRAQEYTKYGAVPTLFTRPLREGDAFRWTLLMGDRRVEFDNYYFSAETYERALRGAGFKDVQWHALEVPPEVEEADGRAFWQYLLEHPCNIVIACQK